MDVMVWWTTLTAADRSVLDLLDPTERARVDSLDRPADRARSLLGAALLRVAVADRMGVSPADVVIDRTCNECGGPHGAPNIVGPGTPAQWAAVSHSGLLVVVAVSGHGPVGVDVQRLSDLDSAARGPRWVRSEALLKAQATAHRTLDPARPTEVGCPVVRELSAPLDGYAAALAVMAQGTLKIAVRHWPPEPGRLVRSTRIS